MSDYLEIAKRALQSCAQQSQFVTHPLETVLKGMAVELWCDSKGERLWIVADEADAVKLGEPRGTVYTATEVRRVIQIGDAAVVAEIYEWKRRFDGVINSEKENSHEKEPDKQETNPSRAGADKSGIAGGRAEGNQKDATHRN